MKARTRILVLGLFAAATCAGSLLPGQAAWGGERMDGNIRGYVHDRRFNRDRYYPQPGYVIGALPRGYLSVPWRGSSYYFYGGSWYRPYGPRYMVIAPPPGIGVPMLPPGYTTVWIGATPYYYADGTYYLWEPGQRGYVVTSPPREAEAAASTTSPAGEQLFVYPKNGQSESQQATDRYECHDWARGQTGYDPTKPLGGVEAAQADGKRADYLRAQKACLEARGYSVR